MSPRAGRRFAYGAALFLVLGLAAGLRTYGSGFGQGYPYARPDEEVAVGIAMDVLAGHPNTEFFHWP